jgi:integrase
MGAMTLLAVNGGLGQTDLGRLPWSALRLSPLPHLDYRRPKTEVDRSVPLWPETLSAIQAIPAGQPQDLVFRYSDGRAWAEPNVTREGGAIVAVSMRDKIRHWLRKLGEESGHQFPGFYALRHTFRTVADEANDQHAIHRIMGHSLPGMSGHYVERIGLDRLLAVTEHVRAWLLGGWSCPWPRQP